MFPCAPPVSKPSENFRTKRFGVLESATKCHSLSSFLQETPMNKYQKMNIYREQIQNNGRNFLPFQENEWEGNNHPIKALETFLSSIDFSSTYIQFENQVTPPMNTKESPCFIRKLHRGRDFKSEEKTSDFNKRLNSSQKVCPNRRLQFSNSKGAKILDAIPEIQNKEVEDYECKYRRTRGKSVDSVMKEKGMYRRRVEAGMFRKKSRINEIERIIEEAAEELSSQRGEFEEERIKKSHSDIKKDSDDSEEEEWRCTSSSLSIYSKLSKENLSNKDLQREPQKIDQEILDFIKSRILKKGGLVKSNKSQDLTRESFSQELTKIKNVIENALVMCQESPDFNLVDSP